MVIILMMIIILIMILIDCRVWILSLEKPRESLAHQNSWRYHHVESSLNISFHKIYSDYVEPDLILVTPNHAYLSGIYQTLDPLFRKLGQENRCRKEEGNTSFCLKRTPPAIGLPSLEVNVKRLESDIWKSQTPQHTHSFTYAPLICSHTLDAHSDNSPPHMEGESQTSLVAYAVPNQSWSEVSLWTAPALFPAPPRSGRDRFCGGPSLSPQSANMRTRSIGFSSS